MGLIIAGAIVGVGVVGVVYKVNDFTPPPDDRKGDGSYSYAADFAKLDASKPIGVFMFNVPSPGGVLNDLVIHASRNNFIREFKENYGDNVLVIDGGMKELQSFARQFNQHFSKQKTELHFLANHHQHTKDYSDQDIAGFLQSVQAGRKRATILSCGPDANTVYQTLSKDFDYILLPRSNGQILGPETSLRISPAYRKSIGWMHDNASAEGVRKVIDAPSLERRYEGQRDKMYTRLAYLAAPLLAPWLGKEPPHTPPVVVVPTGLPKVDNPIPRGP